MLQHWQQSIYRTTKCNTTYQFKNRVHVHKTAYMVMYRLWRIVSVVPSVTVIKLNDGHDNIKWSWINSLKYHLFINIMPSTLMHVSHLGTVFVFLVKENPTFILVISIFPVFQNLTTYTQCIMRHHWSCQSSYQLPWQRQLLTDSCFPTYLQLILEWYKFPSQLTIISKENKTSDWQHKMVCDSTSQCSCPYLLWPECGQLQPSSISYYTAPVQVSVHHTGQQVI